ncbi:MAG: hypothetical protein WB820_21140 [Rhodoplanes sp.]
MPAVFRLETVGPSRSRLAKEWNDLAGVGDWQGGGGAFHDFKLCRFIGRVSGGVERCLTGGERSDWFIVGGEPPPVRKIGSLAEH